MLRSKYQLNTVYIPIYRGSFERTHQRHRDARQQRLAHRGAARGDRDRVARSLPASRGLSASRLERASASGAVREWTTHGRPHRASEARPRSTRARVLDAMTSWVERVHVQGDAGRGLSRGNANGVVEVGESEGARARAAAAPGEERRDGEWAA